MSRPRRPCQYCDRPLGRFARLLHVWMCNACASRLSMGGSPMPRMSPTGGPNEPKGE